MLILPWEYHCQMAVIQSRACLGFSPVGSQSTEGARSTHRDGHCLCVHPWRSQLFITSWDGKFLWDPYRAWGISSDTSASLLVTWESHLARRSKCPFSLELSDSASHISSQEIHSSPILITSISIMPNYNNRFINYPPPPALPCYSHW